MLSRDRTKLHVGVRAVPSNNCFDRIVTFDLTSLPALPLPPLSSYYPVGTGTNPALCWDMDVHPVSGRVIAAFAQNDSASDMKLVDIDPDTGGVVSETNIPGKWNTTAIRIEPTQGWFGYLARAWDASGNNTPAKHVLPVLFDANGNVTGFGAGPFSLDF